MRDKLINIKSITYIVFLGCLTMFPYLTKAATHQMQANGVSLSYIDEGTGQPVVFVHGAFSDLRVWEPQRQAISEKHRFIAYTQRYFGNKQWPDSNKKYSQVTHSEDLAEFIRKLNVGPVYLVGRSYGGTIALRTALKNPELVRGVVAQEPTIAFAVAMGNPEYKKILKKERSGLKPAKKAAKEGNLSKATQLFADWTNNQAGGFDRLSDDLKTVHLENGHTIPLHFTATKPPKVTCEDLNQLKMPIALTSGEFSRPFFKILIQSAHDCINGSELFEIPGARHAATSQNPKDFNQFLIKFIDKH
jgi:pimeloyl-ACP methyl ester carboxylesterase